MLFSCMGPLSNHPAELRRDILRLWKPRSMYWVFRDSAGLDRREAHEVEIRLNLSPEKCVRISNLPGWRVAKGREDGALFLRRKQPLTNSALRGLFRAALVLAYAHGGQFHSWMHEPHLDVWDREA